MWDFKLVCAKVTRLLLARICNACVALAKRDSLNSFCFANARFTKPREQLASTKVHINIRIFDTLVRMHLRLYMLC